MPYSAKRNHRKNGRKRLNFSGLCSERLRTESEVHILADDKRAVLLESTVRAVAKYGMKDVSTRSISSDAGVNDAYIYRCFRDKEDLLMQAYLLENEKFMRHVLRRMDIVWQQMAAYTLQERCWMVFHEAWRYLIDTPDVCRFFMYYYHSPNFEKYAQEQYQMQLDVLAENVPNLFDTMEDAKHFLYAQLALLNSFALQVVNYELPDDEESEKRVFHSAYNVVFAQIKIAN